MAKAKIALGRATTYPADFPATMVAQAEKAFARGKLGKRNHTKAVAFFSDTSRRGKRRLEAAWQRFNQEMDDKKLAWGDGTFLDWLIANWDSILKMILSIIALFG